MVMVMAMRVLLFVVVVAAAVAAVAAVAADALGGASEPGEGTGLRSAHEPQRLCATTVSPCARPVRDPTASRQTTPP